MQNEWTITAAHAEPVRRKMNVANHPNRVVYANWKRERTIVTATAPGWLK